MNDYFDRAIAIILEHGGWVIKPRGDGVHAVFGIDGNAGHEERAARAALLLQKMMSNYPWDMRVGIDAGDMVIGQIGSRNVKRLDCTGHSVNLAARLEGAADRGQIVITKIFAERIRDRFMIDEGSMVALKGIGDVFVHRVHGERKGV